MPMQVGGCKIWLSVIKRKRDLLAILAAQGRSERLMMVRSHSLLLHP